MFWRVWTHSCNEQMGWATADRRSRVTLLSPISLVILLLLQTVVPLALSLGFDDSLSPGSVISTASGADLDFQSEKTASPRTLTVNLMHLNHEKSPYATSNFTLQERVAMAVKSSQARARYFNFRINNGSTLAFQREAAFSTPVYSDQGSYLMEIQLGTPTRTFAAIADTGSDLTWVQCRPCSQCFRQPDAMFDPTQSSTYVTTTCTNSLCSRLPKKSCSPTCEYQYAYGDQSSTQGTFSLETLKIGNQAFPNFGFGCGYQNQGTFEGSDGLVGLGKGPVSLVSQLGSDFGNVFSYCLVSFYSSASRTSPLVFGSSSSAMTNTPLISNYVNPSFYYVNLLGILVNGNALDIPSGTFQLDGFGRGGFIFDSGTTITLLQMEAFTPLINALASLIDYPRVDLSSIGFDLCYDLSAVSQPSVPIVTFQFQGVDVHLPGNNLFLQVDNELDYCVAMQGSNFGFGIFGNVQQQNFEIQYNLAAQQIGFNGPKYC